MQLYNFQEKAVKQALEQDSFAFFAEMGSGKTAMSINTILRKCNGCFPKTLIFTPKITMSNWKKEIKMWAPNENVTLVEGSTDKRVRSLAKANIAIVNYEATRSNQLVTALMEFNPEVVLCDESQRIKNPKANQTKAIIQLSREARYRYILTGTPATNGYMDLFSQFLFLDNGQTFGKSFFGFRGKYFYNKNQGWAGARAFPDWVIKASAVDQMMGLLAQKSYTVRTKDVVELPDLIEQDISLEMSKEQSKHYNELKNDLITFLNDSPEDPMVVQNALTRLVRLNEIINGYMKLESGQIYDFANDPKLEAVEELLEMSHPHKVIVFCCFRRNYASISAMLEKKKIKYVLLDKDMEDKIEEFNDLSNGTRVCICNPKSAGIGINLKSAKYAVFYSRSFSLEEYLQAKARNYRAGSIDLHEKIVHYNLVMKDTIDEKIILALNQKNSILSNIYNIKDLLS